MRKRFIRQGFDLVCENSVTGVITLVKLVYCSCTTIFDRTP
jgi:hypothetical protein